MMIFISAGHHPSKPGAKFERFVEHDEAVIWARELCQIVDNSVLVPTGYLKEKVGFINERVMNGDIAIEIHFNAALDAEGNNVGRGSETLYYPGSTNGLRLAELVQKFLSNVFPPDRGAKEGWYKMDKTRGPDFFLAKTKCPAVIVEPEFVHRFEKIYAGKDQAITAMADAVEEYYEHTEVENSDSDFVVDSVPDN